jgi:hypothetical protein
MEGSGQAAAEAPPQRPQAPGAPAKKPSLTRLQSDSQSLRRFPVPERAVQPQKKKGCFSVLVLVLLFLLTTAGLLLRV